MEEETRNEPVAVLLAAGNGLRLKARTNGVPKPLHRVRGTPLIEWSIRAFRSRGVRRFVVVLGYRAGEVEAHLRRHLPGEVAVDCARSPRFELGNGASTLAARGLVPRRFLLAMGDHLFEPSMIDRLLDAAPVEGTTLLATDRKLDAVFDLAEAMKVRLDGERVVRVGKELDPFDAVDTGLFLADETLFEALDRCASEGRHALADGVNRLAAEGRVAAVDVGPSRWIDVDTPEDLAQAERMLDPADGLFSLERPGDRVAFPLGP